MTTTSSIRLSDTIVAQARRDAETFNRTISGQIEYWVRLGQAVESVPGFDVDRVRAALNGQLDVRLLSHNELMAFEESLGNALATPSAKSIQDMKALRDAGGAVGYDEQGRLIRKLPGGGVEVLEDPNEGRMATK